MSKPWTYIVPNYYLSKWADDRHVLSSGGTSWPRIGIYCPHESDPFLLGSFVIDLQILQEQGQAYWTLTSDFTDGDGVIFPLARSSAISHHLVGDDRDVLRDLKQKVSAALRSGTAPSSNTSGWSLYEAERSTRARFQLKCRRCNYRLVLRSDRVQEPLTAAYRGGVRELSISRLRRVAS